MIKRLRPQRAAPMLGEILSKRLARELAAQSFRLLVDDLEMSQLVEEHVIEHETTDGERRPLSPTHRAELPGRLAAPQESGKADARRQSAQSDLLVAGCRISKPPAPPGPVIEANTAQPFPHPPRQPLKDDLNIRFSHKVPPIRARRMTGKRNVFHGAGVSLSLLETARGASRATAKALMTRRAGQSSNPEALTRRARRRFALTSVHVLVRARQSRQIKYCDNEQSLSTLFPR